MNEKGFLLLFVLAISVLFVCMIRPFLIPLVLAALFTGLLLPAYDWLLPRLGGRSGLTAATILTLVSLVIILPLVLFLGVVVSQAMRLTETVRPWIAEQVQQPDQIGQHIVERFPVLERLRPYQAEITAHAADLAGRVGAYLAGTLSSAAGITVAFIFYLLVMLYAMFFFLISGRSMLDRIIGYMPLPDEDKRRLLALFLSVTRAILKGTFVVGLIQGVLAGLAFAVAGIEGSAFWGTVMVVCSVIPGIGSAIVWVPAVIYLALIGHWGSAIGVGIWCAVVVGTIDNVLRPRLVGRDVSMPALLIFLATLGGVSLFGAVGILLGPIIAALFQSAWEMYGHSIWEWRPAGGNDPTAATQPPRPLG